MRSLHFASLSLVALLALASLGGTCSKPPPYHDVSGTWANASWGPSAGMTSDDGEQVDIDVAFRVQAAVPSKRGPLPASGTICVNDPKHGMTGHYAIDAASSTYEGSDYGGARLDLKAKAQDGRTVEVSQAFMANASPASLDGAIIVFKTLEDKTLRFAFEDFERRTGLSCP